MKKEIVLLGGMALMALSLAACGRDGRTTLCITPDSAGSPPPRRFQ